MRLCLKERKAEGDALQRDRKAILQKISKLKGDLDRLDKQENTGVHGLRGGRQEEADQQALEDAREELREAEIDLRSAESEMQSMQKALHRLHKALTASKRRVDGLDERIHIRVRATDTAEPDGAAARRGQRREGEVLLSPPGAEKAAGEI
eukprot:GHVU01100731.1.p2 GENE.GHVU01100731.1~~GHVU01100731.1.p2  ORF type:complete len:151 (-),score=33.98 GHVU01100731.1:833-1285(-)